MASTVTIPGVSSSYWWELSEDGQTVFIKGEGFSQGYAKGTQIQFDDRVLDTSLCINNNPVAVNDYATVTAGVPAKGNVLSNDSDPDGDKLTAKLVTGPAHGTVTLNADGTATYTANAGYVGSDSFTYQVMDAHGGVSTGTVYLNVQAPANKAPVAVDDYATVTAGEPAKGNVLWNDSDPDGDPLTAKLLTGPAHGTVTLNPDGTATYTANAGYVGPDSFTYEVSDGKGGVSTGTVHLTVQAPANRGPDAVDDSFSGAFDAPIKGSVLGNDSDPDGDKLTAVLKTSPVNGTLTFNADGTFAYVPKAGFVGKDTFTYQVSDGKGGTDTATVTLTVSAPANKAPVAVDDYATVTAGEPAKGNVLWNDSDPDGDPLTAKLLTGPAHGTVTLNPDGTATYTANAGYVGPDSFTYEVSDGKGGVSTGTVHLTVQAPANRAPDAVDDSFSGAFDTPIKGSVLTNDSDPDGDKLTAVLKTGTVNGTLTFNADGTFTYVPKAGFVGKDTFTYQVSDGKGGTDTATVTLTVAAPANKPPIAVDDYATVTAGEPAKGNVLSNDTDPDGDPLTAKLLTGPAHGTVTLNPDGTATYTANAGYVGPDSFTYEVSDGKGGVSTGTVHLTVQAPANRVPDAVDDSFSGAFDTPINGSVLGNDTDPDGDKLTAVLKTGPINGSVTLNADGTFVYTPTSGFVGKDSFTYQVSDGKGGTDIATVTLTIAPKANGIPDAVDDAFSGAFNTPINGSVLGNDTDPDGDKLTAVLKSDPLNGSVTLNADGTFTYTPNSGFNGVDTFTYQVSDGKGGTDIATVKLTVKPNTLPDAVDDAFTGAYATPIKGSVLGNDTDPDGDALTAALKTGPANGTLTLNADGTFTYTPKSGFSGVDSFTYQVSDGKGGTDIATVKLTVAAPEYKATINGVDSIVEGVDVTKYTVQLDKAVDKDTWITVRVDDGTAHRTDGTGYKEFVTSYGGDGVATYEDVIYYTVDATHQAKIESVWMNDPIYSYAVDGTKGSARDDVVGVSNLIYDFKVLDTAGAVVKGNTVQVLVKAGNSVSEAFTVDVAKEVNVGKWSYGYFATETNETFSMVVTSIDGVAVTPMGQKQVTIVDVAANVSPIAFDLDKSGRIETTGSSTSKFATHETAKTVTFDIDGDGDLDVIEWLAGKGDGLLVDASKIGPNGRIDGKALFGDEGGKYSDGYAKLKLLDANGDGVLTTSELAHLKLWVDDGDAMLEAGELQTLAQHGVTSISTQMQLVKDAHGDALMQSVATTKDGGSILTEDVWFASKGEVAPGVGEGWSLPAPALEAEAAHADHGH